MDELLLNFYQWTDGGNLCKSSTMEDEAPEGSPVVMLCAEGR